MVGTKALSTKSLPNQPILSATLTLGMSTIGLGYTFSVGGIANHKPKSRPPKETFRIGRGFSQALSPSARPAHHSRWAVGVYVGII